MKDEPFVMMMGVVVKHTAGNLSKRTRVML